LLAGEGKLKGRLPKDYLSQGLTAIEILQCLYVDDRAFIFASCTDLKKCLTLIHKHFEQLGLEMHIGQGENPSKTECVFFPPLGFFASCMLALEQDISDTLEYGGNTLTNNKCQDEQKMRARQVQEELIYDNLEETKPITVGDGFVSFCRRFKYLGSFVSFSLCGDYNIEQRVTAATQSMGALKNVWNSPHLDIWSKYLLFCAIPMNLLLWGCEAWSMRKSLSNKLEVFLHQNIQRILQVSMTKVREEEIQNKQVRRMFYDIPCVWNMIAACQLDFIGKTVHRPSDRPAKQMLTACCDTVCQIGRPFLHNKDYIVKNLRLLFANVP
jgi:hypothetical protein